MARYSEGSREVRATSGAEVVWSGRIEQSLIGPRDEDWDVVALLRYPSARSYLTMKATPEYQAARLHRQAALEDSRLLMAVEPDRE